MQASLYFLNTALRVVQAVKGIAPCCLSRANIERSVCYAVQVQDIGDTLASMQGPSVLHRPGLDTLQDFSTYNLSCDRGDFHHAGCRCAVGTGRRVYSYVRPASDSRRRDPLEPYTRNATPLRLGSATPQGDLSPFTFHLSPFTDY